MFQKLSQEHFIMIFLLLVVIASAGDLVTDLSQGATQSHLLQESAILSLAIIVLSWLVYDHNRNKKMLNLLHQELEYTKKLIPSKSAEVQAATSQLSEAIAQQFIAWKLSKSEKEVGLLLLKGFSVKEISSIRGTAEKTIRQQASSIYHKSGVPGRHAFAAWFIEDFL